MSERRWDLYVRDRIECCTKVEEYTAGLDRDAFFATDAINDSADRRPDEAQQHRPN